MKDPDSIKLDQLEKQEFFDSLKIGEEVQYWSSECMKSFKATIIGKTTKKIKIKLSWSKGLLTDPKKLSRK